MKKKQTKDNGNNTFHPRNINWSTLNLGRVHLNQIWIKTKKNDLDINQNNPQIGPPINSPKGEFQPPKNIRVVIAATINILAYSAKKNIANFIPLYSV